MVWWRFLLLVLMALAHGTPGAQDQAPPQDSEELRPGLTRVDVTVVDADGKRVPGINITGSHQGMLTEYDPDYRSITDASGLATLWVQTGRYATERQLGTQIWIDAVEVTEDKINRLRNTRQLLRLNYQQLLSRTTILMMPAQLSTDPVHGIAVRIKAVDQDEQAVAGALVTLQTTDMSRPVERQTDANGLVLLEATVLGDRASVEVKASKADHQPGSTRFTLASAVRRTGQVQDHDVKLARLAPEAPRSRVTVSVRTTSGAPLTDAEVRLAPQPPVQGTTAAARTGPEGTVVLPGGAPGPWTLDVRHANFEPHSEVIDLGSADSVHTVPLRQRLASSEDSHVTVTVLALDRRGSDGQPAPIPNALLRWGTTTVGTDENGRARIGFPGQLGVDLRIEAEGYDPATLSVPGGRYLLTDLQRTVRLLPKDAAAQEDSRVEVTVLGERSAAGDRPEPIAGASVSSSRASVRTDAQGKARLDYSGLTGVELRIEAPGHEAATLRIAGGAGLLPNQRREVRLQAVKEAVRDDSELELTVLADDEPAGAGRASPIAGARVARGSSAVTTDAQGKARFAYVARSGLDLRVEADGYLAGSLSVPASAAPTASAADTGAAVVRQRRELRLKRDVPDEKTPVQLRFRVTEAGNGERVAGAAVRVSVGGNQIAEGRGDAAGVILMRLDEAGTRAARRGVAYEVEARGYTIGNGVIAAARLEPARDPVDQPVALDPLLEVKVRVLSAVGSNAPIPGASVVLSGGTPSGRLASGTTDAEGHAALVLVGPAVRAAQRDGLFVDVTVDRYVGHRSTVDASLLRVAAPLYLVQMDFESNAALAALAADVARLETRKRAFEAALVSFRGMSASSDASLAEARARLQEWNSRPDAVGTSNFEHPSWWGQTSALCVRAVELADRTERDFAADARFVVDQLQAGRDAAERCRSSPSADAVAAIERADRAATSRLGAMQPSLQRERQRADALRREHEALGRALLSPAMTNLRSAVAKAREAVDALVKAGESIERERADLARARLQTADRLNRLGPSLRTPNDFALAQSLVPRIDALSVAEIPNEAETLRAASEVRTIDDELQLALENLTRYQEPVCQRVHERFQRLADAMDADHAAADAAARVNNLAGRGADCRASWEAATRQPTLVAVPDLSGLPPAAMANIVRNAGLAWGGPAAAGHAPSPALVGKLASQQPSAFAMVAPGTPVVAMIWQDVVPAPPPPTPPPAVTATPPVAPPVRLATVPDLSGLPSRLSMDVAIVASGLIPAYRNLAPAPAGFAGRFGGQSPAAGDRVAYGSVVSYGIYEAPAAAAPMPPLVLAPPTPLPVPTGGVPSVIGETLERAQARLEAAGLRVGGITRGDRPPNAAMAGRIYHQDPAPGSRVRPGTGVALRQYDTMSAAAPPAQPVPPPMVAGPAAAVPGQCATGGGPIGCTGSFAGTVQLTCDGMAPARYPSTFTLRADGSSDLQIPSPGNQPFVVAGVMDRSGRVQVDRREDGVQHRWVGQFARTAAPGGSARLTGSGQYEARIDIPGVSMKRCTGQFQLP